MEENSAHRDEEGNAALTALLRFMEARGLKAGALAKRAGFSPSAIYNLTAGRAAAPSTALLSKIAAAEGVTIAEIMAHANDPERVPVSHLVIAGGRVVVGNSKVTVPRPKTIEPSLELDACEIAGDGLHPVPAGWLVFYATHPQPADQLVDRLCVVRTRSAHDALIATIREGRDPGTFDLEPWHGAPLRNQSVIAAHRVVSLQPPAN